MKKVYKAHILFTKEKDRFEVYENGYIAVEDGYVLGVASHLKDLNCPDAEVIDFGDKLLIPAMNDMHVHAPQVHNQAVAMDLELLPWLQNYTFPEEAKYADVEYAERMYRRFLHTQWLFGTMRSVVFGTIHTESTRCLMQLYQEAGMGAMVGKVAMNRNCPDNLSEDVDAYIEGMEQLIKDFSPLASGREAGGEVPSLVRPIITPRFVPSCTPELLRACGQLAQQYQLPVQSHLSENTSEIAWVQELEPESESYGDAYNRYGLFGQTPTIMAHCVWTHGKELELMKRNGVMVAHCPTSNFNLSSGLAPIRSLLDEGLRIGLGSDISGGHDLNMFRMLVYAIQVSKMHYQQDHSKAFLTLPEVFWIATKSAGSFFGKVGSFEPGYEFDALVIDDAVLYPSEYSLLHRLERFIYVGDDRQIVHRFCRGQEVAEPKVL
ncbi:amidohydrolase family protein [Xylanibacter brevis]|uniref:amidohydrolase family protein n=1 Tax=Xylanibacter brevis TaxID=83231 RepID=UPI00048647F2|nr:amidohydrolase family protein [Xylanibacter brevis]